MERVERRMSMFKALRNGNFARLWTGGLISQAGDWVLLIGLPIYVYILTRSLLATSITFAAGIVPQIALGSVAGVFVDRWNRKWTLVVANLLLAVALLPLALVRTPDHVWIVYVVIFAETCFEQFTVPAQNALLPALVSEEQLVPANALNALSSNLSRLVGPALARRIALVGHLTLRPRAAAGCRRARGRAGTAAASPGFPRS